MLGRIQENKCYAIIINETSRKVILKKVDTKEGLLSYKDKSWIVDTDPLFYKNQAFYIVTDKKLMAYEVILDEIKETEDNKEQRTLSGSAFTPTALRKVATSEFFKALMSPLYWTRGDWVKAIAVGFAFYQMLRWTLLSIFGVSLP